MSTSQGKGVEGNGIKAQYTDDWGVSWYPPARRVPANPAAR